MSECDGCGEERALVAEFDPSGQLTGKFLCRGCRAGAQLPREAPKREPAVVPARDSRGRVLRGARVRAPGLGEGAVEYVTPSTGALFVRWDDTGECTTLSAREAWVVVGDTSEKTEDEK